MTNRLTHRSISWIDKYSIEDYHYYFSGNKKIRALPSFTPIPSYPGLFSFSITHSGINRHIYAENCDLRNLSKENLPRENLQHLFVANNNIEYIDLDLLENFLEMKTSLTLANNPLICDCQHKSMYETITKMSKNIQDFEQMTCHDGLPFLNRDLCLAWDLFFLYFGLVFL